MIRDDTTRVPAGVLMICVLGLSACVFDSNEMRTWVLPPKQQSIDLDRNHWIPYSFAEGAITVTVKMPPDSRSFSAITLPQVAFDKYSQRRLLDVEYDYRSKSIREMAEFELRASFVQLATPLSKREVNADALNRALRVAWRRPPPNDEDPTPDLVTANGRQWIHLDGTMSSLTGRVSESYGTLIDPKTVFFVTASYWENIRNVPAWFESRRALLQSIRDDVTLNP